LSARCRSSLILSTHLFISITSRREEKRLKKEPLRL